MRTLQIKIDSFNRLQEFNSIMLSMYNKAEVDDLIEYFNLKDLLKKIADAVYRHSNRRVKTISFSIEINHYKSLCKLVLMNEGLLNEPAMVYHRLLLNDVIQQGWTCFEQKYPVQIDEQLKITA